MKNVVNLRQVRKDRARSAARAEADANAARYGRSKAERAAQDGDAARQAKHLDAHRRDDG